MGRGGPGRRTVSSPTRDTLRPGLFAAAERPAHCPTTGVGTGAGSGVGRRNSRRGSDPRRESSIVPRIGHGWAPNAVLALGMMARPGVSRVARLTSDPSGRGSSRVSVCDLRDRDRRRRRGRVVAACVASAGVNRAKRPVFATRCCHFPSALPLYGKTGTPSRLLAHPFHGHRGRRGPRRVADGAVVTSRGGDPVASGGDRPGMVACP
jgi:hypothetical protein